MSSGITKPIDIELYRWRRCVIERPHGIASRLRGDLERDCGNGYVLTSASFPEVSSLCLYLPGSSRDMDHIPNAHVFTDEEGAIEACEAWTDALQRVSGVEPCTVVCKSAILMYRGWPLADYYMEALAVIGDKGRTLIFLYMSGYDKIPESRGGYVAIPGGLLSFDVRTTHSDFPVKATLHINYSETANIAVDLRYNSRFAIPAQYTALPGSAPLWTCITYSSLPSELIPANCKLPPVHAVRYIRAIKLLDKHLNGRTGDNRVPIHRCY